MANMSMVDMQMQFTRDIRKIVQQHLFKIDQICKNIGRKFYVRVNRNQRKEQIKDVYVQFLRHFW